MVAEVKNPQVAMPYFSVFFWTLVHLIFYFLHFLTPCLSFLIDPYSFLSAPITPLTPNGSYQSIIFLHFILPPGFLPFPSYVCYRIEMSNP